MKTMLETARALATNTTTARALVEASLAAIDAPQGQGKTAFIKVYHDQARASADAIDTLRRHGRAPSRFAGIPISIKDLFDVEGEVTTAGAMVLADNPPAKTTAPAIARLLAAGLIPVGRTNMTEFAFSGVGINPHYGTPLSPYDREAARIPGGSSSGAAVSVADGMVAGAIGTDTGGSCRIPAALCGIAGFKPTQSRVPLQGAVPLSPSLDSIGPLAATAACCAVLDAILAGEPERQLPTASVAGLRLLLPVNFAFDHLDGATERAFDRAILRLDRAGALIDRRRLAAFEEITAANAKGGFAAVEAFAWHRDLLASAFSRYDPRVATRIAAGADMAAADFFLVQQARARIIKSFTHEMANYDAVILPTVPIMAPKIAEFADDAAYRKLNFLLLRTPSSINFLDGCAISLPCQEPGAPPAGVMLAAPGGRDARLLALAIAVEEKLT